MLSLKVLLSTLVFVQLSHAFYWIQWTPNYWKSGEEVTMYVNKAESDETQLPYSYYDLPFTCPPTEGARPKSLSLGEVLRGDRIWGSDYHLFFEKDESCKRICNRLMTAERARDTAQLIKKGYVVEWILDGLPGATTFISTGKEKKKYYAAGFPIGFVEGGRTFIHNHVMIVVRWHKEGGDPEKKTIVGFEVYPRSVSDAHCPGASKNFQNFEINPKETENTMIPFTYAVYWREETELTWNDRWNLYFAGENSTSSMRWISLANSLVLVLLLSVFVGVVMVRILNKDIENLRSSSYYKAAHEPSAEIDKTADGRPTTGWRSIEQEAFFTPTRPLLLSVLAGSGVQMGLTITAVLVLCVSGLIGPSYRGSVMSISVFLFIIAGFVAGFAGVQFYKVFAQGSPDPTPDWKRVSLYCGLALPASVFTVVFVSNFFVWAKNSTYALPLGTFVVLILGCLTLELPLSVVGGYISNKHSVASYLMAKFSKSGTGLRKLIVNNDITAQKQIPRVPLLNRLIVAIPLYGLVQFSIIYVELMYIFRSMWQEKTTFYYMYGFLFGTMTMLVVVILETSVMATYRRLNSGDYHWQWSAFFVGGSVSFYMSLYCIHYSIVYLNMSDLISLLMYFTYTLLVNLAVGITCGAIGLIGSAIFVHSIYGAIKVD